MSLGLPDVSDNSALPPDTFIIEGKLIESDYVFSTGKRLKGHPCHLAKKYVETRARGKLVCDILGEELIGPWEINHRGPSDVHQAKMLGPACRGHNAGGHDKVRGTGSVIRLSLRIRHLHE